MYAKTFLMIDLLAHSSTEYVTSLQISKLLKTSTRMVLRYVKDAQANSLHCGFQIVSQKGRGYRFQVTDKAKFEAFCSGFGEKQACLPEEGVLKDAVKQLLIHKNCKLDDLAELFHYSRSSMSRVSQAAGSYLELFGLSLVGKPYAGLSIEGNEIRVRDCMYNLYQDVDTELSLWEQMHIEEVEYEDVSTWITACMKQVGIIGKEQQRRQFFTYLCIAIKRISLDKEIGFSFLANLDQVWQSDVYLNGIAGQLQQYFPLRELGCECMYLSLIWIQTFHQSGGFMEMGKHDMVFFHNLIMNALKKIRVNYGIDLSGDEILVNGLTLHVASSYGKYLLHMESENPFYEELQKNYPAAYYYSIELAECIYEYTKLNMSNSELGFLTMYFASCLERSTEGKGLRTAILGGNTPGTLLLLKSRIEKVYQSITVIGAYSLDDCDTLPCDVDFYISIVPMDRDRLHGRRILTLSPFLNEADQKEMKIMISSLKSKSGVLDVCSEDCFFVWDKPMKKKVLLSNLCEELISLGRMDKTDLEAVMSREELVSTEIAANVAMPHCLIEGESFLAFGVLKTPVMWGKTRVRLVILGCFQKGDRRIKGVLEHLFQMISGEDTVNRLVSCHDYREFTECIKELDGGNLC